MKYIIMCGGKYPAMSLPKQLVEVNGEALVERTIRLLRSEGVEDIGISSNNKIFEKFGVPVLEHDNGFVSRGYNDYDGLWCEGFYLTDEPTTYLFGDVFYSPDAIGKIIETETDDIAFFGSAPPFAPDFPKRYIEPFGFKVVDTDHLKRAVLEVREIYEAGRFDRPPIAWEVWNVINNPDDPNKIDYDSYIHINDYTCDIDGPNELYLVSTFATKEDVRMAEEKKTTKKKTTAKKSQPKKKGENGVIYKGMKFQVLEKNEKKILLTDGTIHFWARRSDVTEC